MANNLFPEFLICLSIVMDSPIQEHIEPPWELLAFYVILGVVAYVVLCFMAKKPAPPHRNLLIVIYFCCLAGMVIAGLPVHWHIEFPWQEPIPTAFYAIFGFAACVFLIYFAKGLRLWLPKDYDYYEKKRKGRE